MMNYPLSTALSVLYCQYRVTQIWVSIEWNGESACCTHTDIPHKHTSAPQALHLNEIKAILPQNRLIRKSYYVRITGHYKTVY
jgi:hypothetical protein